MIIALILLSFGLAACLPVRQAPKTPPPPTMEECRIDNPMGINWREGATVCDVEKSESDQ